jgi:Ca2+-binding EF-hand superfamily protein
MSKSNVKGAKPSAPAPAASKSSFDAKAFAKNGVTEEEVTTIKTAFDLFDTDQGGSIDIKGTPSIIQNSKPQ